MQQRPNGLDNTRIDNILLITEREFLDGVQCGRMAFMERTLTSAPITAADVQHVFNIVLYNIFRSSEWRYGYLCGWNHEFYDSAVKAQLPPLSSPKELRQQREEER